MNEVDDAAGEYLTVNEAADHAGVSRHKIARLIRSGVLAVYESDLDRRRRYVRRSDLAALRQTFRAARGPVLTDPDRPPVPLSRLRADEQI